MTSIVKVNENDAPILSEIAKLTFIESHGSSAGSEDIKMYVAEKYNNDVLKEDLQDPKNIYHIIYYDDQVAGYSKIILNDPYTNSKIRNITKMERLYLLKKFYNLNLGSALFEYNIDLIKENDQAGVWLFVWKGNPRAVSFYKKKGFMIIGSHDFKISETHSNPNHQMFLGF